MKALNDIKTKYEGNDFSRQEEKVGFMDKYIESKNYSKEKSLSFAERFVYHYGKNKYISLF